MSESDSARRAVSATLLPGFVGTSLPDWLAMRLRDGLGGVCLFGPNIVSPTQLRDLTDSIFEANPLAVIAIDEEGGDVTRLHYTTGSPQVGNAVLGRIDDPTYTRKVATEIGWDLRRSGFNLDFAPDADINSNPDNPVIGVRSFGVDPGSVGQQTAAWVEGLQSTAVAACVKHFPGHGDTAQDSHLSLPVIDRSLDELRERELVPFVAAIAAGTKTIMSSHIMLPQLDSERPATHSRAILRGLLRDDLGFDGVIVSDALDMVGASGTIGIPEAAVRALDAGCDLLCIGSQTEPQVVDDIETALLAAIEDGRLEQGRVQDAADRVISLAKDLERQRGSAPVPAGEGSTDPTEMDIARAEVAFDVQARAREALASPGSGVQLVRIETGTNVAVGTVPWGPGGGPDDDGVTSSGPIVRLDPSSTDTSALVSDRLVVVLGRDIHRHAFARETVDRLRAEYPAVVVVDMGWPSDDRAYADIATFGASRAVSAALLRYLSGSTA
jgi:beta-N-acetylhexosaminidase